MPAIPPVNREDAPEDTDPAPPSAAEQAILGTDPDTSNHETTNTTSDGRPSIDEPQHTPQSSSPPPETQSKKPKHPPQTLPTPLLRLHIHDLSNSGTRAFLTSIDASCALTDAVNTVCSILYNAEVAKPSHPGLSNSKDVTTTAPTPSPRPQPPIPQIRSVTLFLDDTDGVAYTTGMDLDNKYHKEIHLSLSYVQHVVRSNPSTSTSSDKPSAITHELLGVLIHETVHTLQHNGQNTCPGGLIEGIADYVRLKANLGAPHWKKPTTRQEASKHQWDAGYQNTAFFLDWLERKLEREGRLVAEMNEWLEAKKYEEDIFWKECCGSTVKDLFQEYLGAVEEEAELEEAIRLSLADDA
jgi:hypothetical protein